jgi:hypothetical protein
MVSYYHMVGTAPHAIAALQSQMSQGLPQPLAVCLPIVLLLFRLSSEHKCTEVKRLLPRYKQRRVTIPKLGCAGRTFPLHIYIGSHAHYLKSRSASDLSSHLNLERNLVVNPIHANIQFSTFRNQYLLRPALHDRGQTRFIRQLHPRTSSLA